MSGPRRLQEMRRVVDRVRSQARRAREIAEQLTEHQLPYAPEFRHHALMVGQWADVLDGRLDSIRDPRGMKRASQRRGESR